MIGTLLSGHSDFDYPNKALQREMLDYLTRTIRLLESNRREEAMSLVGQFVDRLDGLLQESVLRSKSDLIRQVQQYVTGEATREASVKTIADKVRLHPAYLSRIYKRETGECLGDYIIRIRMEKALYLLRHTGKKIGDITMELGYRNPQFFSKTFKKHYGMTPGEYRSR